MKHSHKIVLGLLLLALVGFFSFRAWKNMQDEATEVDLMKLKTEAHAKRYVEVLEKLVFDHVTKVARMLTDTVQAGLDNDKENIFEELAPFIKRYPEFSAVGMAFKPNTFDDELILYAPRYQHNGLKYTSVNLADYWDYHTGEQSTWYHAISSQGLSEHWSQPFLDPISKLEVIQYTLPLSKEGEIIGVFYIQYGLKELKHMLSRLDYGENGFYFILFDLDSLPPPDQGFLESLVIKDIPQNFTLENVSVVQSYLQRSREKRPNLLSQKGHFFAFQPLEKIDWVFVNVRPQEDIVYSNRLNFFRNRVNLVVNLLIPIVAGMLFLSYALRRRFVFAPVYIVSATIISLALLGAIIYIWIFSLESPVNYYEIDNTLIHDKQGLDEYEAEYTKESLELFDDLPVYVPTGIFIQSVEFPDKDNVRVTAYVWQKYAISIDDSSRVTGFRNFSSADELGVIFPDAVNLNKEKAYKRIYEEDQSMVLGWYVEMELRQNFDLSHFPLDYKDVQIRMWHQQFQENVVLIPDLDSYDFLNPTSTMGLDKQIVTTGWTLEGSFFSYLRSSYNTNFGLRDYRGEDNFPELSYSVIMQRQFLSPFISYVTPIFIVAILLFFSLYSIPDSGPEPEEEGSGSAVIQIVIALFFAALLSHIDLRRSLPVKGFFYLEFFYFSVYLMLIIVTIHSELVDSGAYANRRNSISEYNFWFRLAFWPSLLTLIFLSTLFLF